MKLALTFLAVGALLMTTPAGAAPAEEGDGLTLEAIFASDRFESPNPEALMWLPDGSGFIYRAVEDGQTILWREGVAGGRRARITDWDALLEGLQAQRPDYAEPAMGDVNSASRARREPTLSPDGTALVGTEADDLYLLDLNTGEARFLTQSPTPELFPGFSPDGTRLAFVRDGDLYWLDLSDGSQHRLTDRGTNGDILNGMADWVYEEELDVKRSFWWSPDSRRIAFAQYDTKPESVFPITDDLELYATLEQQRYPKAGTDNASVRLGVIGLAGGEPRWIELGSEPDFYLAGAGWSPSGRRLWFQWLDRAQENLELRFADPDSGRAVTIVSEHDPTWVNVFDGPMFAGEQRFVWSSERDGWRHLYLYANDGTLERQLTAGEWQVTEVYGVDAASSTVYFQATEKDLRQRHIYSVSLDGTGLERLSTADGTHEATFSPVLRHFVDEHSTVYDPPRLELYRSSGMLVRTISAGTIDALSNIALSPFQFGTVESGGVTLHTCMIRPPDLDPTRTYPVLLYVYGGPHSQLVTDSWGGSRHLFFQLLARHGIIVFWLDNRGTTGRGKAFESAVDRRLGELELADQLAGVEFLKSLRYVDPERIAVYGGSYGGTMTLLCLLRAPETFTAGIAYAPVTDWRFYDTIYTERYMDNPADNPEGYRSTAPLTWAGQLAGRLLLVHGAMDNNVHLQNSLSLVNRLAEADIGFQLMVYPRVRHPIRTSGFKLHFHRLKTQFLLEQLKPEP